MYYLHSQLIQLLVEVSWDFFCDLKMMVEGIFLQVQLPQVKQIKLALNPISFEAIHQ